LSIRSTTASLEFEQLLNSEVEPVAQLESTFRAVCGVLLGPRVARAGHRTPGPRADESAAGFVLRCTRYGSIAGAACGGCVGLAIGVATYLPTSPVAAVEGAVFGVVPGVLVGALAGLIRLAVGGRRPSREH
jgi:hypothetical protein